MAPNQLLTLGPPLKTRATNKDKHPGLPDVTKVRRTPAEMQEIRQEAAQRQQEKENIQKNAMEDAARFEDKLQEQDKERERQRVEHVEKYKVNLKRKGEY
jgi:hypothetical protein